MAIKASELMRHQAADGSGHQQQIILRTPAELEPGELERLSAEIKQYALEPEPTDADRQMVDRVKAEADRFMLVSPEEAERLRAQIDNPLLMSLEKSAQMAAQYASSNPLLMSVEKSAQIAARLAGSNSLLMPIGTTAQIAAHLAGSNSLLMPIGTTAQIAAHLAGSMAPAALGEYAAELMRPPRLLQGEYWSGYRESIRQALEPIGLSAALSAQAAALGIVQQVLNPMALDMISTTMEMMREQGKQMAEMAASWAQPFGAMDVGWAAMSLSRDLQMVRGTLSMGALDDLNVSLGRLYEQRQAPPARRPEPPAEQQMQVVHLAPGDWQEALTHALTSGQASRRDVAEFLHSFSTNMSEPGQPPAEWAQIETVAVLYRDKGHLHSGQEAFVMWVRSSSVGRKMGLSQLSLSTFHRWITKYEQDTGEKIREGRGKRKRRQL